MKATVFHTLWQELSNHIDPSELGNAAETMVHFLVDQDYDIAEIKSAFKGDPNIKQALVDFQIDDTHDEFEDDEEFIDEEDEDY